MKFEVIVGNPPYQGVNHQQIYPKFYLWARNNCNMMSMIFPISWQYVKIMHGLGLMNTPEVKRDKQIVYIDNIIDGFNGVTGAKNTNIVYWKRGYDNGLNGKQLVYTDGKDPKEIKFNISKSEIERIKEITDLVKCLGEFTGVDTITTGRGPYSLGSDLFINPTKFGITSELKVKKENDDIRIFGKIGKIKDIRYINSDSTLPKPREGNKWGYWKILLPINWGNFSGKYLGGAYSNIIISGPTDLCTESYLECGKCNTFEEVQKHSKYCMSKFARALLLDNKFDYHNNKSYWVSVPIQDYSENFWNSDNIDDIDEGLFNKYNVPEDIRKFVIENIQPKTTDDILGYDGKDIDLFYKV